MIDIDSILRFLGQMIAVGGGAATIAYLIFQWLGKKSIDSYFVNRLEEHKHDLDKQLESYRYEVNSLFNRITKIHEKEFEVLPLAWSNLQEIVGKAAHLTSLVQTYPDFKGMPRLDVEDFVKDLPFTESQKIRLLATDDISKEYIELDFWYKLREAQNILSTSHNYLIYNKIFLSRDLFDKFSSIDSILNEVLLDKEFGGERSTPEFRREATKRIKDNMDKIKPLIEGIEELVQSRLHYPDA